MNAEERELIRALPNRLLGIIFGIILVVNADPFGKAAPEEIQDIGEVTYKGYSTAYLHTSPESYAVIDEMVNSLSGLSKKDSFYLKEAIITLDDFLMSRQGWLKQQKINQK